MSAQHWAYVEWAPEAEGVHEIEVDANHSRKDCAAKSAPTAVSVECDVWLPDVLRHAVSGETKESALAAARRFALDAIPYGGTYSVHYIGAVS